MVGVRIAACAANGRVVHRQHLGLARRAGRAACPALRREIAGVP